MGNHFTGQFTEAGEAVGDGNKSVFVLFDDITGVVPAVDQHFFGFFRILDVALHNGGAFDKQQTRAPQRNRLHAVGIENFGAHIRQRTPHRAFELALLRETVDVHIGDVDRNHGRAFGGAIAFQRPDPITFSAPTTAQRKWAKVSGLILRTQAMRKVGVPIKMVARYSSAI